MEPKAYGKMGERDAKAIDAYLACLPNGATILNLGCGPHLEPLYELGRAVAQHRREPWITLIFADVAAHFVEDLRRRLFVPGTVKVAVKRVDILLDSDVVAYFQREAERSGRKPDTLINATLRQAIKEAAIE
ncbi:MAG: hypothetical protein ACRERD_15980 [Candidatus Binatia bacterium]